MSFDLSNLSTYTDQLSTDLISAALLKPHTVQHMSVLPGKTAGTSAINIFNSIPYIIDQTCGFSSPAQTGPGGATGNTSIFDQLDLVVATKMMKEELCPAELRQVWLSSQMTPSAYQENVPFEAYIAQNKVNNIKQYIENTIWAGDGGVLDGVLSQATIANGCIGATAGVTVPLAVGTAFASIWNIYGALSNALKQSEDLVMYMSMTNYAIAVRALMAEGNALITQYPNISNASGSAAMTFIWPGTNMTIFGAPGLASNTHIICGRKSALFFGTGLMDDEDRFRFFYDPSVDVVKFYSAFKLGTAVYTSQFASTV